MKTKIAAGTLSPHHELTAVIFNDCSVQILKQSKLMSSLVLKLYELYECSYLYIT